MRYLQKLPLMLALAAALLMGFIGFLCSMSQDEILVRMALGMVIFYVVGFFIRTTLLDIHKQVEDKRKEKEMEEKEQKLEQEKKENENKKKTAGRNINLTAGEEKEDLFEPLPVSEFIKKELKHD